MCCCQLDGIKIIIELHYITVETRLFCPLHSFELHYAVDLSAIAAADDGDVIVSDVVDIER